MTIFSLVILAGKEERKKEWREVEEKEKSGLEKSKSEARKGMIESYRLGINLPFSPLFGLN